MKAPIIPLKLKANTAVTEALQKHFYHTVTPDGAIGRWLFKEDAERYKKLIMEKFPGVLVDIVDGEDNLRKKYSHLIIDRQQSQPEQHNGANSTRR